MSVQVLDSVQNLVDRLADEPLGLPEMAHQVPIGHVLHEQEHVVLVLKVSVKFGDVGVGARQQIVNFQLHGELF